MEQILAIDPITPFLIPSTAPLHITVVGCGGTGSHVVQALARIAAHTKLPPKALTITLIDGDTVEAKNVGRQLFAPSDIGQNKAQVLATRFNHAFGLTMSAIPRMFGPQIIKQSRVDDLFSGGAIGVLVGCVDTADARQLLATALNGDPWYRPWKLWLDSGNHEAAGQVLVGSESDREKLGAATDLAICTAIPSPALQAPDLLVPPPRPRARTDCAAAQEDNVQALMINQTMAAIASQYLAQIIIQRRLTTMETIVDLSTLTMRSTPITARTVRAFATRQAVAA